MTRSVRLRLLIFALVGGLAVVVAGVRYAGVLEVLTAARGDYVNLAVEMDLTPLTLLGNTTGTNEEPGGGTDLPGPDLPSDPLGLSGLLGEGRRR